jgi:hypothetical protein
LRSSPDDDLVCLQSLRDGKPMKHPLRRNFRERPGAIVKHGSE